jgi:hypothetical protein
MFIWNPNGESNAKACIGTEMADVAPPNGGNLYTHALAAVHVERRF